MGSARAGSFLAIAGLAVAALAVLALVASAWATTALATVGGGCTVSATSTSGGAVDLTTTRVWHLHSTDRVSAVATAPSAQTAVTVRAFAFGFAIPVASGTSPGTTAADATDIEMRTFATFGRVFAVGGTSSGPAAGCEGQVIIVLDDVNPLLTVLGVGAVLAIVVGLLGTLWASRRPLGVGGRIAAFISFLLAGAGASLLLQQTATPPQSAIAVSSLGRSGFVESLATPSAVSVDPYVVLQSGILALIVLVLLPFPSQLFNRTLEENYEEIRDSFRRRRALAWMWRDRPAGAATSGGVASVPPAATDAALPPPPPPPLPASRAPSGSSALRLLSVVVVVLASGLLYGLLDPRFGADSRSLVTFVGLVAGLLAVTWAANLAHRSTHHTVHGDRGRLWAPWGVLGIAALCVLISRIVGFQPGYLYGLILGYRFTMPLESRHESRAWAASGWWMLVLALVAWLTLGAVRMPGLEASVPAEIAATVLAAMVVAGVEAIVFELVPVRFLPGEVVFRWRRVQWAVLYAFGVFAFAWIILNPANGFLAAGNSVSLFAAVGLFVAFGLVSVLFWGYFRFRPSREVAGG